VGLGAKVVEELPGALTKVQQHLVFARFIGKMAVDQGVRELRGRMDGWNDPDSEASTQSQTTEQLETESPTPGEQSEVPVLPVVPLPPEGLALPDYDQLPAAHIVGKLAGLTATELDAIEAYEMAHRHRRTVLGKINQLRSA